MIRISRSTIANQLWNALECFWQKSWILSIPLVLKDWSVNAKKDRRKKKPDIASVAIASSVIKFFAREEYELEVSTIIATMSPSIAEMRKKYPKYFSGELERISFGIDMA